MSHLLELEQSKHKDTKKKGNIPHVKLSMNSHDLIKK